MSAAEQLHQMAEPIQPGAVAGVGTALPPGRLTNTDLEERLDTTTRWITERTGITERRVGGATGDLAVAAARRAVEDAGCDPSSIDLVILATSTPDQTMPATAVRIQAELGTTGGAYDLNAACSGFVFALISAFGAFATGTRRVLVVGADAMSRIVDPDDRGTAILFGDGAGALVLDRGPATDRLEPRRDIHRGGRARLCSAAPGLLGADIGTDGNLAHLLSAPLGGTIAMEGREVFRQAVRMTVESSRASLDAAGLSPTDVDLFVPHQANRRIIDSAADRLGIPAGRTVSVIEATGNTSAASIPLALAAARSEGRLTDGSIVLMAGFGAGMSWATSVIRWGEA